MKVICFVIAALLSVSQPLTSVAMGQQGKTSNDLSGDVFLMTQSLDELIQLIKSQQSKIDDFHKLQAAISYLSFRSRSIETKQMELRFKKDRRENIESTIVRIKDDPDKWDEYDKTFASSNQVNSSETRPSELRLKLLQDKLESLNTEIITLDTEIQNSQDELASFESYVQKKLELIQ